MFKALLLTKTPEGATLADMASLDEAQLPKGEVLVDVAYSTVNYKDALAITGSSPPWASRARCRPPMLPVKLAVFSCAL